MHNKLVLCADSGLNIVGLFLLSSSMQRSVLYCCVSMIKFDRDHGKVCGLLCYQQLCYLLTDGRLSFADMVLLKHLFL